MYRWLAGRFWTARVWTAMVAVTLLANWQGARADGGSAAIPLDEGATAELPIWQGTAPGSESATQQEKISRSPTGKFTAIRNVVRPTLTVYLPDPSIATGTGVIIAPGGAFRFVNFDTEGTQVAKWLAAKGIAAFVLKYRVIATNADDAQMWADLSRDMANPAPLIASLGQAGSQAFADGRQAMQVVRAHAQEWGIDAARIGFMGFSAGAMVTSRVLLDLPPADRPAFAAPIYGAPFADVQSPDRHLPPVFLAYASDDPLVPKYVQSFYQSLRGVGLHPELHVYKQGGHGFGMVRQGTSSDHWIEDFYHWLEGLGLAQKPDSACEQLKDLQLADTVITDSHAIPAGLFQEPGAAQGAGVELPARCDVRGTIKPTGDSKIDFEVWMPARHWNGKLQGAGNGGFGGSITYQGGLIQALQRGYAGVSTDTGHAADADASWAIGHPEKVVDFGHRSVHLMTVDAKQIIKAYYGEPPRRSYFASCSNGGRQGLMLAQRYPDDYDGIVAGAPANDFTGLFLDFLWNEQALMKPGAQIPAEAARLIQAEVIKQCDALDGVRDGVISAPEACHFEPAKLLCTGADSKACLTPPQVGALRAIYGGMRSKDKSIAFPGFTPGGEVGAITGGWDTWIFGTKAGASTQSVFAKGFMSGIVTGDRNWQPGTFEVDRDAQPIFDKWGPILNATDPDLSRFAGHGGKLIMFHGWADPAIPPRHTIQYFEAIGAKLGVDKRAEFVRLFMAPGLQHCFGGPGPTSFGGITAARQPADPSADLSAALENWVERGIAPEEIVAKKPQNALPAIFDSTAGGTERTGLLCAYPKHAKWNGSGDQARSSSFTCVN
jgi:acetyl esterase/lipase